MAGITKNITRAMIRSNNPYTLYDMYNVLGREENAGTSFARSNAKASSWTIHKRGVS